MTSTNYSSLTLMADESAKTDSTRRLRAKARKEAEQVRQRFKERYSSHPLYAARSAKDPEFWNKFSPGGVNLEAL